MRGKYAIRAFAKKAGARIVFYIFGSFACTLHENACNGNNRRSKEGAQVRKRRRRGAGWFYFVLACGAAALMAALWWRFAQMGLFRPTMRDAVFVRRVESLMKEGKEFETQNDAGAEGI